MSESDAQYMDSPMPDEPPIWYARYTRFRLMWPTRKIALIFQQEESEKTDHADPKEKNREKQRKVRGAPTGNWYEMAAQWRWLPRAAAWDEHQAREIEKEIAEAKAKIFMNSYARVDRRVQDLTTLAEILYAEAIDADKRWLLDVKAIGTGPNAERVDLTVFSSDLVREFRATLDDIAKELGERVKKSETTIKSLPKVYIDLGRDEDGSEE